MKWFLRCYLDGRRRDSMLFEDFVEPWKRENKSFYPVFAFIFSIGNDLIGENMWALQSYSVLCINLKHDCVQ